MVKCATPNCGQPATKAWGIDKSPVCDACYAEIEIQHQNILSLVAIAERPLTEESK